MLSKTETFSREINELKKVIQNQENYISEYKKNEKTVEDIRLKLNENIVQFKTYNENFKDHINELKRSDPEKLNQWISSHLESIEFIKEFSGKFIKKQRIYSKERLKITDTLENAWQNFSATLILPETYKFKGYNLFFDFDKKQVAGLQNISSKSLQKIQYIEQLRQSITKLSIRNSNNDTALDKGSAWGIPEKEIEKAAKDYKIVAQEIKHKDAELCTNLEDLINNDIITCQTWTELHLLTCISIVDYSYAESAFSTDKDKVRISLSCDTFYEWKSIITKEKKYLIPNTYYLNGYDSHFNLIVS